MKIVNFTKLLTAILLLSVITLKVASQNCSVYFPTVKGTVYEMQQFDNKDKQTGTSTYSVSQVTSDADGNTSVIIHTIYKGKNDKDTSSGNLTYTCKGDKVYLDMKNFMPAGSQMQGMDIKTDGSFMEIPQTMTVGMTMSDATSTMSMYNNGSLFMTVTTTITDRKVESSESVTTPAGTFQCFKVSYKATSVSSVMGIKTTTNSKGVEYYSTGTGMVKSESYDKNDKLQSYNVLSKITNP
jgi:hypothetical protein